MVGRIVIDDIVPLAGWCERPARVVTGERVDVSASIWVEDDDAVAAALLVRGPRSVRRVAMSAADADSHQAIVVPDEPGLWTVRIEAWTEPWRSWEQRVRASIAAFLGAPELDEDLELGARLLERVAYRPDRRADRDVLLDAADGLRAQRLLVRERVALALSDPVCDVMRAHPVRARVTRSRALQVRVEQERAGSGAWYELSAPPTGGRDVLDRVADLGFSVVCLPPVHLVSDIGTLADFDRFVDAARERGLDVALDLALHCTPDHPWVHQHPEFFGVLPDGVIPGAGTQRDTYPLDFDNDPSGLRAEILRVMAVWLAHGVRIFRIRQAHRVPLMFSQWLIGTIQELHPDVVFVAEAPTTRVRRFGLARAGFSQVDTRITECADKAALTALGIELAHNADEFRPHVFVTDADENPAAAAVRAVLAATICPTWSVHSGLERDGISLGPWLGRLNEIRAVHPAFTRMRSLAFHRTDNDALIAYSKVDAGTGDIVLCVVNLDTTWPQDGVVHWDFASVGLDPAARYTVFDEVTGELFEWGEAAYVKLDPNHTTARIGSVTRS